ncbi:hypothetical protein DK749_23550 [Salmonella enterica subsp. salamae]|uniref:Uncharacterized protein n=1 Tax=Salmonella enterica subsp. salamae TaxID=59202 RepID=A0A5Y3XDF3_SALER|nr:hypothetical protein [Salmonella enterica subsp. salamae]ECJ4507827.1 hypothetical protein [Salmonella enterica subsp. salamae]
MAEAINTDSKGVAKMFHNAAWGVQTLWFELVIKNRCRYTQKNRYTSHKLREKRGSKRVTQLPRVYHRPHWVRLYA